MGEHRHLRRLDSVWIEPTIFFVTICAAGRRPVIANAAAFAILLAEFEGVRARSGWRIGRFIVMPDHLHFFCVSDETSASVSLSRCVGAFKQWTAKRIIQALGAQAPVWQRQFFDHLLRSEESYDAKWAYVRNNPVRAGLVEDAEDWPYAGEINVIAR